MPRTILMSRIKSKLSTRASKSVLNSEEELKRKVEKQSQKIIAALEEVKKVRERKKTPKSFDDFLDEL